MSGVESWLAGCIPAGGRLAVDVGANEGAWTATLADRFDDVHAFEPNPQALPLLRATAGGRVNVRLFEAAVNYACGPISLNIYPQSEHASMFTDDDLDTAPRGYRMTTLDVPAVALDDLGYQEMPLDFLKIDVEGAEAAVLTGARETIEATQPAVLIEIHSLAQLETCEGILRETGYQPARLPHPHAGVAPGHCWLVAGRPW